jgi:hypothetical protein
MAVLEHGVTPGRSGQKQEPQGWEAAYDKPSHELFDPDPPGGPYGLCAVLCPRRLATQGLWRSRRGQSSDPRLGAAGRPGRWERLLIDRSDGHRRAARSRSRRVHGFDRSRLDDSRSCRRSVWLARRGGIRRHCSRVSRLIPGQLFAANLRGFGGAGRLRRRSRICPPGAGGTGSDRRSHATAGTGKRAGRLVVAQVRRRRTRVTE